MSLMGMLLQSERAKLTIHTFANDRIGPQDGPEIVFQFNPATLSINKTSGWKPAEGDKAAPKAPPAQFTGPAAAKLSLDLLLDAQIDPNPDITGVIKRLSECLVAHQPTIDKNIPTPKLVSFKWGTWRWGPGLERFEGYLESLKTDYQLFSAGGSPLRAKMTLVITEFTRRAGGQNPTSGTLVPQRSRTLRSGDTLAWIAWEEYDDPTAWRVLAEANDIDDPLRLAPGTQLLVPRRKPPRERR